MATSDSTRARHRGDGSQQQQQQSIDVDVDDTMKKSTLKEDYSNIAILLLLYTLQGVPMGFAGAVPLILKERGASFSDLALFSVATLPFSAKLFWAPIVDSVYLERFGRRKTWLIPSQLAIGAILMWIAYALPTWLGEDADHEIQIVPLTVAFFGLFFLCATQDIAVDGWALTMLKPQNVGYAATCNTIGQTVGYFESFVLIIALVETGYVSFGMFTFVHGVAFIVVTIMVWLVKKEAPVPRDEQVDDVITVYYQMADVVALPVVKKFIVVLLTWKFSSAVAESLTILKIQELGMPKEHTAMLSILLMPVQILVPMVITKYTGGDRPLDLAVWAYIPRTLIAGFSAFVLVYFAPVEAYATMKDGHGSAWDVWPFYVSLIVLSTVYSVFSTIVFVSQVAFFNKVSDESIGGTYMTLLNTIGNLGSLLSKIAITYSIDLFTFQSCFVNDVADGSCVVTSASPVDETCSSRDGICSTTIDGYYVMTGVCFFVGLAWYYYLEQLMTSTQNAPLRAWRISTSSRSLTPLLFIFGIIAMMMFPSIKKILAF